MNRIIILFMFVLIYGTNHGQTPFNATEFTPQLYFKYSLRCEFINGDNRFAIGYDSIWIESSFSNNMTKNVYLWNKIGATWIIASPPLRTDYVKYKNGKYEYDCWVNNDSTSIENGSDLNKLFGYVGDNDGGYSYIKIINGVMCIKILSFSGIRGGKDFQHKWEYIYLTPNNGGFYNIRKKI